MGVLVLRLAFDFERTAIAHRACSTQLWLLREQYRSVLSDLKDGVLSVEVARDRRDYLMEKLHRIYDNAPPADREQYQSAKQSLAAVNEATLTDEEIDRFLPPSLQKAGSAPQTSACTSPERDGARAVTRTSTEELRETGAIESCADQCRNRSRPTPAHRDTQF